MTKYLDLDALVADEISIRLNGVDHKFKEMTVEDFVWAQKKSEEADKTKVESDQVMWMIQIVQRSFPSVTTESLMQLPMAKLMALMEFVMSLASKKDEPATQDGDSGKEVSPTVSP